MPIYVYECRNCSGQWEVFQRLDEGGEGLGCPSCGKTNPRKIVAPFRTNAWSTFLDGMERKVNPHKFKG